MSSVFHQQRRLRWTAVVAVGVGATFACVERPDVGPGEEAQDLARCHTHTSLAALPPMSEGDLLAMVGRGFETAQLDSLGIMAGLVGNRTVQTPAGGADAPAPQTPAQQVTVQQWRSPQYHDCQDLILGGRYTSRAGVYADVRTQLVTDSMLAAADTFGHRLAHVQWLAGAPYDNLALPANSMLRCVYVKAPSGESTEWLATVLDCTAADTVVAFNTVADTLRVNRLTYNDGHPHDFGFLDYPPVARWEWDTANQAQAYGFKCGTGWCVVGREMPGVDMTHYGTGMSAQEVIHGWRDEQLLADSTDMVPGNGVVSGEYAVIVPAATLDNVTNDDLADPAPVMAGSIYARSGGRGKYDTKYGFNGRGRYRVRLAGGLRSGGPGEPDTTSVRIQHPGSGGGGDGPIKNRNAIYRHLGPDLNIIATARWAWSLTDEEQWWGCPDGCCETLEELGGGM